MSTRQMRTYFSTWPSETPVATEKHINALLGFSQETDTLKTESAWAAIEFISLFATKARDMTAYYRLEQPQLESPALELEEQEWSLTAEQTLFMMQRHNAILEAYERDDMDFLKLLEASEEYQAAFGAMSWDEAFDRYESTWIDPDETSLAL